MIKLYQGDALVATFEPDGPAARMVPGESGQYMVTTDDGLKVALGEGKKFVGSENVPSPQEGTLFV